MGFASQNTELQNRFNSIWGTTTPVDFPNIDFTLPSPPASWIRFRVQNGDNSQLTIGAATNVHRNMGLVMIQIFVPMDDGDIIAMEYADIIANGFRNWCGTNITCRQPKVKEIGNDRNGYYQVNVMIPFQRDDCL